MQRSGLARAVAAGLSIALASVALAQSTGPNEPPPTRPPAGERGGGAGGGPGGGLGGRAPGGQNAPGGGDPARFIERVMGNDANGDGKLSKDELPGPLAERMFDRADANKDGFVDRDELTAFARTQNQERGGEGRGPERVRGGQAMSFEAGMKQAGRSMKALSASAFDAGSRAADLEAAQALQMGILASKGQIGSVTMSDAARTKFGSDKAAYETAFRTHLLDTLGHAIALERAILAGNSADAKAALAKLEAAEESGHNLFQS
jgi:hypothetical protein